jgi:hypothetical protein
MLRINDLIKILVVFFAINIFISCTHEKILIDLDEIKSEVKVDSINPNCILNPFSMRVVNHMLVISNNARDSVIDVFSLPEVTKIATGVCKGNGPDEIVSPNTASLRKYKSSTVQLQIGIPATLATIRLPDLSIVNKKTYTIPKDWKYTQSIIPIEDGLSLVQQGELPMKWATINQDGDICHTFDCEIPEQLIAQTQDDMFPQMLLRSSIAEVSSDGAHIVICYRTFPKINIFDSEGVLVKSMTINYEYTPASVWIVNMDCTDDRVYINIHNPSDKEYSQSTILSINWDGEIVKAYAVPKGVAAFCVNDQDGVIYFTTSVADYIYTFRI